MNALPRAEGEGVVPPRCSQIQIKLEPGVDVLRMKRRVDEAWMNFASSLNAEPADRRLMNNVRVSTWEEMQSGFIAAIKKEKVLVVVMFSVISVVAVFLVLCIFYMIVLEKTRDIGIVKSVGGSAEGVAAIFLTYGAAIGIVGSLLGSAIGYLFVRNINGIQDWLARLNPEWRVWSPETYSFDKIPDVVNMSDVVFISIAAVLASIIGAVVPAIRASRTWPVEALRYE
jgi:lipoprotein-releasing system permease protein